MTTTDKAHVIIDLLYGRMGFDDWWSSLDAEIKADIIAAIAKTLDA